MNKLVWHSRATDRQARIHGGSSLGRRTPVGTPVARFGAAVFGVVFALGLSAGLAACSAPGHAVHSVAPVRTSTGNALSAGSNPGGSQVPASPAERAKALSSFGKLSLSARVGVWGGRTSSVLSRLITRLPANELPSVSKNWSGYQVISARTHVAASSAAGAWVVPKVSSPNGADVGFSSIWVGIGGSCLDASCKVTDQSLIQLGTWQIASPSGQTDYFAWYEVLPAAEVMVPSLAITPGDKVTASLALQGNPHPYGAGAPSSKQTWALAMTVQAPGGGTEHWSKILSYDSSLGSAEWVTEGPSIMCNGNFDELPLAKYSSVTFSGIEENGYAPNFGLANLVLGYDPYGELSLPAPSFLLHGRTATYYVPFVTSTRAQPPSPAGCRNSAGKGASAGVRSAGS